MEPVINLEYKTEGTFCFSLCKSKSDGHEVASTLRIDSEQGGQCQMRRDIAFAKKIDRLTAEYC